MNKKNVTIFGTLVFPLGIGQRAVIQEKDCVRTTSPVQHFVTKPSGEIQIETRNTWYLLKPAAAEVRRSDNMR